MCSSRWHTAGTDPDHISSPFNMRETRWDLYCGQPGAALPDALHFRTSSGPQNPRPPSAFVVLQLDAVNSRARVELVKQVRRNRTAPIMMADAI